MTYDTWLQSGPGGPLVDDAELCCHDCGWHGHDDREPCFCELRAVGMMPFAWEEALIVAVEMDAAFGLVPEALELALAGV
jgi:hypothetical protein